MDLKNVESSKANYFKDCWAFLYPEVNANPLTGS